jgi:plastocyanin
MKKSICLFMKTYQLLPLIVLIILVLALGCSKAPAAQQTPTPSNQVQEAPKEQVNETTPPPKTEPAPVEAEPSTPVPDETPVEPEVPEIAESEVKVISLKDLKPYPSELHITPGTTVEWRNINDKLQHIIGWAGQKGQGVKPEPILMGESWSYTFTTPGTVKWYSTARPTIQGTIYIEE